MSASRGVDLTACFLVLYMFCCSATGLIATVCETDVVCLYCRTGLKLDVHSAVYGRDNPQTCSRGQLFPAEVKCTALVTTPIKTKCDGMEMCTFSVSNAMLNVDPCPNMHKYIVINYDCVGEGTTRMPTYVTKQATACERQPLLMGCPAGRRVDVMRAVYGRGDADTCKLGYFHSINCGIDVRAAVAARCFSQQTCTVVADNTIGTTDPCPGTYKYLIVDYRCVV